MPTAIYRPPPSPFIGGRQPLEGRKVTVRQEAALEDFPWPRRESAAIMDLILRAWQPLPTRRPRRTMVVTLVPPAVDAPPIRGPRGAFSTIIRAWQPDLSRPTQRRVRSTAEGAPPPDAPLGSGHRMNWGR